MPSLITLLFSFFSLYFLCSCTAAVVGGVVATTSVAMDKRTLGHYVEDQNIKAKFSHLFYQDKKLSDQTHINVTSYNQQVLITGEVRSTQQKQKISNIANQIKNVRHYYNEVSIGNISDYKIRTNDSFLTSKIKAAIFSNIKELKGAQVKVVTERSYVYLMGLVSQQQGNQITEIVRTTQGVKRVIKLFEYPDTNNKRI
jgi:osmotically-inducible protein OsmY